MKLKRYCLAVLAAEIYYQSAVQLCKMQYVNDPWKTIFLDHAGGEGLPDVMFVLLYIVLLRFMQIFVRHDLYSNAQSLHFILYRADSKDVSVRLLLRTAENSLIMLCAAIIILTMHDQMNIALVLFLLRIIIVISFLTMIEGILELICKRDVSHILTLFISILVLIDSVTPSHLITFTGIVLTEWKIMAVTCPAVFAVIILIYKRLRGISI